MAYGSKRDDQVETRRGLHDFQTFVHRINLMQIN